MKTKLSIIVAFLLSAYQVVAAPLPTVKLATSEWPPYVSSDLNDKGYVYVIVTEAFKKAGYHPLVEFCPWTEAEKLVEHHNDAVFPSYNRTGIEDFVCSVPVEGGPVGFYKRKSTKIEFSVDDPAKNQLAALQGLKQHRFGVVSGYLNTPTFDSATFLQKQAVPDDLANLEQLQAGKVDLIFIDVFVAQYLIEKNKPKFDDLEFMGPALDYKKVHVCFSNKIAGYETKLSAFNQGLKALKDSGELKAIINKYNE